jgi:ATP-dependent Lon protease
MALGGMRDEAEIRGHRRTYIGAMPGKVLQSLTKVGTRNPLFLLDEIDKLGMDSAATRRALLEVLDPEPHLRRPLRRGRLRPVRRDVRGHLDSMNIPPALLDRMEVIRLSGYTEDEKSTSPSYLLPKQLKNNGVKETSWRSPRTRCATSCATTPARPACARSSASCPRSAARWSRRCSWPDEAAVRSPPRT